MTTVDVELDIFSGLPNPRWTLSDTQATEFLSRLSELPESAPKSPATHLGYRGLIVEMRQGASRKIIVHAGGVAAGGPDGSTYFSDPGRSLERWLLATGRAFMSDEILREIPSIQT